MLNRQTWSYEHIYSDTKGSSSILLGTCTVNEPAFFCGPPRGMPCLGSIVSPRCVLHHVSSRKHSFWLKFTFREWSLWLPPLCALSRWTIGGGVIIFILIDKRPLQKSRVVPALHYPLDGVTSWTTSDILQFAAKLDDRLLWRLATVDQMEDSTGVL